jgi:DNA-binding GntR family transcriptional regulator
MEKVQEMSLSATSPRHISRASLGDQVYDHLINSLLAGDFDSGDELNELSLAAQFGVSRTPVREALRRLAAEGLVINTPNRQATVIRLSPTDIAETYDVRRLLESSAAGMAAGKLTPGDLQTLRRLATAAVPEDDIHWGDPERRFDDELHRLISERCGNSRLRHEVARYLKLVRFVRTRVGRNATALKQGHVEHERILDALEAGDRQAAEVAMSAHIASALRFVLDDLSGETSRGPDSAAVNGK